MKTYNINKLPTDGYLVLPVSMSRISSAQAPEICYDICEYFLPRLTEYGLDVILLYTNGLYFNTTTPAIQIRRATNEQMTAHRNGLNALIKKNKHFMPQAFHYLPWDYAVLNSEDFQGHFNRLRKACETDIDLSDALKCDLKGRNESLENIDFVIEEVVMTHLIRQKMVTLPRTLVREDNFRLIIYPGPYIALDRLQFEKHILPHNKKLGKRGYPYGAAHYDYSEKCLYDFSKPGASI